MMKIAIQIMLYIVCCQYTYCQIHWAQSIPSDVYESPWDVEYDSDGNVYVVGQFYGGVVFDEESGEPEMGNGDNSDIYLLKLNSEGDFLWVRTFGGSGFDIGFDLTVDTDDNPVLVGDFENTMTIADIDGVQSEITSSGELDVIVIKLNSQGDVLWFYNFGGIDVDQTFEIASDGDNNVYLVGSFEEEVAFDISNPEIMDNAGGTKDAYILKLNENGDYVWHLSFYGGSSDTYGLVVETDNENNVYVSGQYSWDITIESQGEEHVIQGDVGYPNSFILKLDEQANILWTQAIIATNIKQIESLRVSNQNEVFIAGYFEDSLDLPLNNGNITLESVGGEDSFIMKLDSLGNMVWVNSFGGPGDTRFLDLSTDNDSNIFLVGNIKNTYSQTNILSEDDFTSAGESDIVLHKMSNDGDLLFTKTMGGAGNDWAKCIDIDEYGDICMVGLFYYTIDIDPSPYVYNLTSIEFSDTFIVKFGEYFGLVETDKLSSIKIYPNPTTDILTVNLEAPQRFNIQILESSGRLIYEEESLSEQYDFNVSELVPGSYYVKIKTENSSYLKKFVKL